MGRKEQRRKEIGKKERRKKIKKMKDGRNERMNE
jgi:hypothetical protein